MQKFCCPITFYQVASKCFSYRRTNTQNLHTTPQVKQKFSAIHACFLSKIDLDAAVSMCSPNSAMACSHKLENDNKNLKKFIGIFDLSVCGRYGQLIDVAGNKPFDISNPYVDIGLIRKYHLKKGQKISATILYRKDFHNPKVTTIDAIDDLPPTVRLQCSPIDRLTSVRPSKQIILEHHGASLATRIIDMFCPIAHGQRGILVSPPCAGKTLLLHDIARTITLNSPDIPIIVALIDERPEEVTDFRRSVSAEIYASPNDQGAKNHIKIAQLASERAKNLAETGKHAVLIIDSITRLARACNFLSSGGKTMTGGIDSRAMEVPRGIFSSARATEDGGSLTVIATALVDTGSKMDDLIFQELKGTGNLEIVLDRKLAEQRIWPAIDLHASGTRHEEIILPSQVLQVVRFLRRAFANVEPEKTTESLLKRLSQHDSNRSFFNMLANSANIV